MSSKGTAINFTSSGTVVGPVRSSSCSFTFVTVNKMSLSSVGTISLSVSSVTGVGPKGCVVSGHSKFMVAVMATKSTSSLVTPSFAVAWSGPAD